MYTNGFPIEVAAHGKRYYPSLGVRAAFVVLLFVIVGIFFIEAGVDFENYAQFFDLVRTYDLHEVLSDRVEPLFGLLVFFLTRLYLSDFFVYFFILLLSLSLKVYVLSSFRQTGVFFALLAGFYLFRYFPLYELTQIRVSLAIGFVMLAFQQHGTWYKWVLFLLGCLTHYSIVVLFPLMFFVDAAQRRSRTYVKYEKLIWLFLFICFAIIGLMSHTLLQYITPYFTVLQIYDVIGFGETAVSPITAAILLDMVAILSALVLLRDMSASTRFWIYIQILGMLSFYALIELPIMAFRIKELFCVFWIFYIRDALEYRGAIRLHGLLFIISCIIAYFYFYFLGKSAIFPIHF